MGNSYKIIFGKQDWKRKVGRDRHMPLRENIRVCCFAINITERGSDDSNSGWGTVVSFREHCNEPPCFIRSEGFLDYLSNY
jgi:hypothetical protein